MSTIWMASGKLLAGHVPDPGGAVADDDLSGGVDEAAPLRLAMGALREGGRRPSTSDLRTGTPVPSSPTYIVGAAAGAGSTRSRSSAATSRPSVSAVRSTCLGSTATPASSPIHPLASAKLTLVAAKPTSRVVAGDSDVFCASPRPGTRVRAA